jgi:hypothetical protein
MEMTLRYTHLAPDVRRDAVQLLDLPAQHRRNMALPASTSTWSYGEIELGN